MRIVHRLDCHRLTILFQLNIFKMENKYLLFSVNKKMIKKQKKKYYQNI